MNRLLFILLATAAIPLSADAVPPDSTNQISQQVLARYFAAVSTQAPKTRGVDMDMHFSARLPRMKKEGVMLAKRIVSSLGKISFVVKSFTGDNTVKTYVITKYMAGEADLAMSHRPSNMFATCGQGGTSGIAVAPQIVFPIPARRVERQLVEYCWQ